MLNGRKALFHDYTLLVAALPDGRFQCWVTTPEGAKLTPDTDVFATAQVAKEAACDYAGLHAGLDSDSIQAECAALVWSDSAPPTE